MFVSVDNRKTIKSSYIARIVARQESTVAAFYVTHIKEKLFSPYDVCAESYLAVVVDVREVRYAVGNEGTIFTHGIATNARTCVCLPAPREDCISDEF